MRVRHPAFFEAPGCRGSALLCEISYSGARLEADEPLPPLRATVRVYVWPERQDEPFELVGTVVGRRPDGFAVEYDEVGQQTCQWIDLLQASADAASAETAPAREGPGEAR
jgi:PilZ domain